LGIYFDYFRAQNSDAAMNMAAPDGRTKTAYVDVVSLKRVDPLKIAKVIAFLRDVPWTLDTVQTTFIWPPASTKPDTPEDFENLPEDSPWFEDSFLEEFEPTFRDELASFGDAQFRCLAEWTPSEEWRSDGFDIELVTSCVKEIVELAKRACTGNEKLFVHGWGF